MFGPSKRQLWRAIREERAQHRLEVQNLLDRLANYAGQPWTPAPADIGRPAPDAPDVASWTAAPEQEFLA